MIIITIPIKSSQQSYILMNLLIELQKNNNRNSKNLIKLKRNKTNSPLYLVISTIISLTN